MLRDYALDAPREAPCGRLDVKTWLAVLGLGLTGFGTACASMQERILAHASDSLNCPRAQISLSSPHPRMRQATGCGKAQVFLDVHGDENIWIEADGLLGRAAFDLGCEKRDLQLTPLAEHGELVMGVTGCGQKATYVHAQTSQYTYGWVMDSASKCK
jgi:hypothetical protein